MDFAFEIIEFPAKLGIIAPYKPLFNTILI